MKLAARIYRIANKLPESYDSELAKISDGVSQLEEYAGLLDRYYVAGRAMTLAATRRIGELRKEILNSLSVASNDSPEK